MQSLNTWSTVHGTCSEKTSHNQCCRPLAGDRIRQGLRLRNKQHRNRLQVFGKLLASVLVSCLVDNSVQVCAAGPGLLQKLGRVLKEKAQGDLDRVFSGTSKTRERLGVCLACIPVFLMYISPASASFDKQAVSLSSSCDAWCSTGRRRAIHLLVS